MTKKVSNEAKVANSDEYDRTIKVLKHFFLVPAVHSGKEIKLKVKFLGSPEPASKEICNNFNFEFGKTIYSEIKVLQPNLNFKNFNHIFIENYLLDKFFSISKEVEYEIYAKIMFKESKIEKLTANFRDRMELTFDAEEHWEQMNPDYEEIPDEVLVVGDGQIALMLKDIKIIDKVKKS